MTPVGTEGEVIGAHGGRKAGGDGLLPDAQVGSPLDETLQEHLVGALFEAARLEHHPVDTEASVQVGTGNDCDVHSAITRSKLG